MRHRRANRLFGAGVALVAQWTGTASAEAAARFSIAPQSLASALNQYGVQSGDPVIFSPDATSRLRSRGARGALSPEEALDKVLEGTNLKHRREGGTVLIYAAATQSAMLLPNTETRSDIVLAQAETLAPAPAAGAPAEADASPGGDIIVTARRRDERLQDVPLSIVALSQETLTRASIASLADVTKLAAGLVFQPSTFGSKVISFTLRGQRQNFPNITYDPSVVPYFAEVPVMRQAGANAALYDLASVQVLKGPQGTLFGRNATGGAVLITPAAPGSDWGGYAKLGLGNYDQREIEAAINMPFSDAVRVRLSARHTERDGFEKVIGKRYSVNDDNLNAIRASISLMPDGPITNNLVVDYSRQKGSGTGWVILNCFPAGRANVATAGGYCADFAKQQAAPFHSTTSNVDRNGADVKVLALSNITSAELGSDITLKNIFGYRRVNSFITFDIDGSSLDVVSSGDRMKVHQLSDELQLLGKTLGGDLEYQVGAFYFREAGDEVQQTPTLGTISRADLSVVNRSASIYGQASYHIPGLSGVTLTGGVRETWDRREMTNRGRSISPTLNTCRLLTANIGGVPINPCEKTVAAKFDALTYNVSLDWKVDKDLLLYVASRKGYRSGGFSHAPRTPAEFAPYQPETVHDYEVGMKADYRLGDDITGRTNFAAYIGKYKDIQRNLLVNGLIDPLTGGFYTRSTTINAASATIKGIEIDQTWRLFRLLELTASYAYVDAGYDKFILPGGIDYSQAPFAGTPKHTLSGTARLELPVAADAGQFFMQVSGAYRSSSVEVDLSSYNLTTRTTSPFGIVPGYTTYDARFDWQNAFGHPVTLSLWIRNLTDKHYVTAVSDASAIGSFSGVLGAPRTYGIEARYSF